MQKHGAVYNAASDLLERHLGGPREGKAAYVDALGTCTFRELEYGARQAGKLFSTLGLQREQRVFLCMHDSRYLPMCFLGAIRAGIVPVLCNTLLTADDYVYMLTDSRAAIAIVSAPLAHLFEPLLAEIQTLNQVIIDGGDDDALARSMAACDPSWPTAETSADESCFWLYSSGSTGRPKGTVHAHSSLLQTADLYAKPVLSICEDDVVFSAAKLFFAYGLGNALSFPLSVGATTVLLAERPTPELVFDILRKYAVTIFYGVPTLYAALLASKALPNADTLRLRRCTSAGEALPPDIAERWREQFGTQILDGIGSTEMLHIFLSNRNGDAKPGTTGKPLTGYDLKIVDDDGVAVSDGDMGELMVRGPTAATAYWNQRAKSRATFLGEWTRTGDKYRVDEGGYYVYCGRADDMLKVGGIYVSPTEVEAVLTSHEAVLEAAVVGRHDENQLIKPQAFVVLRDVSAGHPELAQELKEFVKSTLAPYKYPRWIEFVEDLPKTATGKIQRFKLRCRPSD